MTYSEADLHQLTLELCRIPSISGIADGENELARFIRNWLGALPYFFDNPGNLMLLPAEGDSLGRYGVYALVRASRPTRRTVIISGHLDVVDVDVCGSIREWAFDPEEYTRRIKDIAIDSLARRDLESGHYMFGRGIMDMKAGLAIGMAFMAEAAGNRDALDVNILFLVVGDEENNSTGMRGAIPHLARLGVDQDLEFLAFFLLEPTAGRSDDPNGYFSIGTVGKLMPFFLCVGKETHVGKYFDGLSAPLIASQINLLAEGNPETTDQWGDEIFTPMTCLKMNDLRDVYSVTVPERAIIYYNQLTVRTTTSEILEKMKKLAIQGLDLSIKMYQSSAKKHRAMGLEIREQHWTPRVMTFHDLVQKAETKIGKKQVEASIREALDNLPSNLDAREEAIVITQTVLDLSAEKGPLVVVGILPPFYPSRVNRRKTPGERALARLAGELVPLASEGGKTYVIREVFPGISDMSWLGFQGKEADMGIIASNMPGWGRIFQIPFKEMQELDIPVLNLGPFGYDSHKQTERLEIPFSFEVTPRLLRHAVFRFGSIYEEEC
ncbi:MAG: M20 family metallopeptidase [Thermovirga sp.]